MSANHNEEEIEIEDESASEEESSETSETSESEYNWIMWFITQRGREFYCQVDEAYIRDGFNLTGLNAVVLKNCSPLASCIQLMVDVH